MNINIASTNLYTDPFSTRAKELSFEFDLATQNQDASKLEQLIKEA